MKTIGIFEKQLELDTDQDELYKTNIFFNEYFSVFNKNPNLKENTEKILYEYSKESIYKTFNILKNTFEKKVNFISDSLDLKIIPDLIVFIGDGSVDGHGALVNGKPYVFFDLSALILNFNKYNIDLFVTHELLHGIHYSYNPCFYPKYYNSIEEKYFKRMIAEGIATNLSPTFSSSTIEDSYWMGFFNKKEVQIWVDNCEKMKNNIVYRITSSLKFSSFDKDLYHTLYTVSDLKHLTNSRLAYYYGSQIINELRDYKSINEILSTDYEYLKDCILSYFQLN
ncbi:hypothetical protein NPD7_1401 [Clostridium sporogenes]|uniref:hypothetical protein n=1 Tax=Clostridium TaxID=1485 RepID=UPI0005F92A70|nr:MULTISPECIES: hypothetical protein [Clostridium]APF26532.1 hypothetical protein NPD7_1401 [Clostridium sporogenes]MDI6920525.1 hypothetical protein [Clostridium botulinum]WMU99337.1 hypothetical protein QA656_08665 [Clostridium botulinum]